VFIDLIGAGAIVGTLPGIWHVFLRNKAEMIFLPSFENIQ
jgi:hypothetical protein